MDRHTDQKYTYEEFLNIIETLRGENGCPWDRVQTHESLKPCMTEEAAELLASIRIYEQTGNPENMREELGDVLLQVVMHAQIAAEEGLFTMEDVVDEISRKMVRRHPHVFGTGSAEKGQGLDRISAAGDTDRAAGAHESRQGFEEGGQVLRAGQYIRAGRDGAAGLGGSARQVQAGGLQQGSGTDSGGYAYARVRRREDLQDLT